MSFGFDVLSREMQLVAQHGVKYGIETALYYNVFQRWAAEYGQDEALADRVRQAWSQLPKIDNSWRLFKPRFPAPFVQFIEEALRVTR